MAVAVTDSQIYKSDDSADDSFKQHNQTTKALFNYFRDFEEWHPYDVILRNQEYYFTEDNTDYDRYDKSQQVLEGNEKGEFDLLLIDTEERNAYYIEVKNRQKRRSKAREQLKRAKNTFEELSEVRRDFNWNIDGKMVTGEKTKLPHYCYRNVDKSIPEEEILVEDTSEDDYESIERLLTGENLKGEGPDISA